MCTPPSHISLPFPPYCLSRIIEPLPHFSPYLHPASPPNTLPRHRQPCTTSNPLPKAQDLYNPRFFLNLVDNLSKLKFDFVEISNLINFSKLLLFNRNIKINTYNRDYCLTFYRIEIKLYLTIFIISKNLEYY